MTSSGDTWGFLTLFCGFCVALLGPIWPCGPGGELPKVTGSRVRSDSSYPILSILEAELGLSTAFRGVLTPRKAGHSPTNRSKDTGVACSAGLPQGRRPAGLAPQGNSDPEDFGPAGFLQI